MVMELFLKELSKICVKFVIPHNRIIKAFSEGLLKYLLLVEHSVLLDLFRSLGGFYDISYLTWCFPTGIFVLKMWEFQNLWNWANELTWEWLWAVGVASGATKNMEVRGTLSSRLQDDPKVLSPQTRILGVFVH